jgi:predicted N-formylglutamate amidohydrolase
MLNDVRDPRAPVAGVAGVAGVADRPHDRPAFASHEVIPGDPGRGLVIVCDHALNDLPPGYGTLGLPASALRRHIAYDIGVEPVTRQLAGRLGAPAVLAGFSRLLIDPNRGLDDPTLIMQISDGTIVPDNVGLEPQERERRIALYYRAYHEAIDGVLDAAMASGRPAAVLSIHSFTPTWRGVRRPWQAGVLWNYDGRFALPLIERLRGLADLVIGDNEPYAGGLKGDTLDVHATARGLPDALIEIRQDLVGDAAGVAEWVDRLATLLPDIIDRLGLTAGRSHTPTGARP